MEVPFSQDPSQNIIQTIPPRSGVAFLLKTGQLLKVISPAGKQVSDLFCFNAEDSREHLSTSRSMDYADKIYLTQGDHLYSNRSGKMLTIVEDTCGRHDLLMPPCSLKMFQITLKNKNHHPNCHENLYQPLAQFQIRSDQVDTTFNIFMNVTMDNQGRVKIEPPLAQPGAYILFQAQMDLFVGLTACSHPESNAGECKPIEYAIL